MQSLPRVTAIVDTFNHARFIEQALTSVLAQGFSEAELQILVVDDGSTRRWISLQFNGSHTPTMNLRGRMAWCLVDVLWSANQS
jgi:cellulose synthase/poly-beta-1,6-N-acetylglucosamine synthase-like glycosyltransferase